MEEKRALKARLASKTIVNAKKQVYFLYKTSLREVENVNFEVVLRLPWSVVLGIL